MLSELMLVCNDHLKDHKLRPQITTDFNVAGAIRDRIEILTTQEQLLKCDAELRTGFKQVFEPIPHVNKLPSDICASIHLKNAEKKFPVWTDHYQLAFDAIKSIVVSRECLTTIDLSKLPKYKIFVTTDASDKRSGAVLSFGKSWSSACPVAFDSMTFKGAELNYPVHEKKL